jgi:hypothetical protein
MAFVSPDLRFVSNERAPVFVGVNAMVAMVLLPPPPLLKCPRNGRCFASEATVCMYVYSSRTIALTLTKALLKPGQDHGFY